MNQPSRTQSFESISGPRCRHESRSRQCQLADTVHGGSLRRFTTAAARRGLTVAAAIVLAALFPGPCSEAQLLSARDPSIAAPAGGNGHSTDAVISPGGRFVVFSSAACDLVPGDDRQFYLDVFLRDRASNSTVLVSINLNGTGGGDSHSLFGQVSTNGRYVVFQSDADNLVTNDANGSTDIFIRDLVAGATTVVSVSTNGVPGNGKQNVRVAINRMTRELRMAGFGGGGVDGWSSTEFFNHGAMYGAYSNVVNPAGGGTSVTVVEGFQPLIATTLSVNASTGSKSIFVNDASSFDTANMQYISIDGSEAHCISAINAGTKELQFNGWDKLTNDHLAGEPVYLLQAITYSIGPSEGKSCLLRDDHLGAGPQPVAENVETLQFAYFDVNGNPTANPPDIRMIQLNVVARTDMSDPDIAKTGDGFRRRTS